LSISSLQKARYSYKPKLPAILSGAINDVIVSFGEPTESISDKKEISEIFKNTYGKPIATFVKGKNDKINHELKVGVILSGGQAPGGHNVIAGFLTD